MFTSKMQNDMVIYYMLYSWLWPCFQDHHDHRKFLHLKLLMWHKLSFWGFERLLSWLKVHLLQNYLTYIIESGIKLLVWKIHVFIIINHCAPVVMFYFMFKYQVSVTLFLASKFNFHAIIYIAGIWVLFNWGTASCLHQISICRPFMTGHHISQSSRLMDLLL